MINETHTANTEATAHSSASSSPALKKEKTAKKQSFYARFKSNWENLYTSHPWFSRLIIALLTCAALWLLLWFILFSGMSESADILYAKF